MILTKKQEEGLKIAIDRWKNKEKCTVISGFAGAGKSTLVRFIVQAMDVSEDDVCYCAYTGKATQVLQKKGNKNVSTLHKLLYDTKPLSNGKYLNIPKASINYKVIIVDEVSMAPMTLMKLLFRHNCYVICLGDPFQLPPIDKNEDNHLLDNPHIFLDEIMRQAQESEIIRTSMKIRNRENISNFNGKEVMILDKSKLTNNMLLWADQILVGTNRTRIDINTTMRALLGREGSPQVGDKIICLRNYFDIIADNKDALVNGTIGYIKNIYDIENFNLPYYAGGKTIKSLKADFISDSDSTFSHLNLDNHMILTGEKCVDNKTEFKLSRDKRFEHSIPLEFTYGYAVTTWKAQGSEWSKILLLEENFPFDKTEHARFLYTACTRAVDRFVWIRS